MVRHRETLCRQSDVRNSFRVMEFRAHFDEGDVIDPRIAWIVSSVDDYLNSVMRRLRVLQVCRTSNDFDVLRWRTESIQQLFDSRVHSFPILFSTWFFQLTPEHSELQSRRSFCWERNHRRSGNFPWFAMKPAKTNIPIEKILHNDVFSFRVFCNIFYSLIKESRVARKFIGTSENPRKKKVVGFTKFHIIFQSNFVWISKVYLIRNFALLSIFAIDDSSVKSSHRWASCKYKDARLFVCRKCQLNNPEQTFF